MPNSSPTFEKLNTGIKVKGRAQKIVGGRKTVNEIDPRLKAVWFLLFKITFYY